MADLNDRARPASNASASASAQRGRLLLGARRVCRVAIWAVVVVSAGARYARGEQPTAPRETERVQAGQAEDNAPEQAALAGLTPYKPAQMVTGTIRLWGHGAPVLDFMGVLVKAWEKEFSRLQPGVKFEYDMYGTASAMGALYTGAGDVAILGQEIYPFEVTAFERVKHYAPTGVEIATGSLDVRNFDFAMMVFVHRDNPLGRLTLEQMNSIFAYQDPGGPPNIRTWGQLGLQGERADRPIQLYGWRSDDIFSTFLQHAALHGSHRWRCEMKEYVHIKHADGTIYDSGQQILDALEKDPDGIAVSNLRYLKTDKVKALAIGRSSSGPFVQASKAALIDRTYPLGRIIPAIIDRKPGQPVDPKVKEFLRYLLSREGQAQIVRNGKYLPLSPAAAQRELEKLR